VTHRVLLVREWDSQTSGSGCCGRLGDGHELAARADYHHNRMEMEAVGGLYRALRERYGSELEICVVDPRNMIWLAPAVWRDARARGMSVGDALRQVRAGISYNSVVVDGKVLFHGRVPHPDEAFEAVARELGAPAG